MGADAVIIGLVGALLGVAISNMFVLLLEKKRRYERQLDLVFAIHAEISAGLGANQKLLTPEEMAYALADQTRTQRLWQARLRQIPDKTGRPQLRRACPIRRGPHKRGWRDAHRRDVTVHD